MPTAVNENDTAASADDSTMYIIHAPRKRAGKVITMILTFSVHLEKCVTRNIRNKKDRLLHQKLINICLTYLQMRIESPSTSEAEDDQPAIMAEDSHSAGIDDLSARLAVASLGVSESTCASAGSGQRTSVTDKETSREIIEITSDDDSPISDPDTKTAMTNQRSTRTMNGSRTPPESPVTPANPRNILTARAEPRVS